jgi:hypothetical protein
MGCVSTKPALICKLSYTYLLLLHILNIIIIIDGTSSEIDGWKQEFDALQLTENDIARIYEIFKKVDMDGSGKKSYILQKYFKFILLLIYVY